MIDLTSDYINKKVNDLIRKYKTRDPIELLEALGAVVGETSAYARLKGYCFMSESVKFSVSMGKILL